MQKSNCFHAVENVYADLLPALCFLKAPFLDFKINFLKGRFKSDLEVDSTSKVGLSCTRRSPQMDRRLVFCFCAGGIYLLFKSTLNISYYVSKSFDHQFCASICSCHIA